MIKNIFKLIFIAVFSIVLIQCKNENKFTISKSKVGGLTDKTTISELYEIFKNDSIIKNLSEGTLGNNYFQYDDEYLIFEKGGKHLLTIIPKEQLDSLSTIKSVQVFDKRFRTKSGLSLTSSFEDININNKITNIETSLNSAILFIDDLNVTITIDKEELGLRKSNTQKISLEQIPDLAKMKSYIIWFD